MANVWQIVRAKENPKSSHSDPDQRHASTNGWKLYVRAVIKPEAWPPLKR